MLNLADLCRLLMLPFGAIGGLCAAQANKAGALTIIIFTCVGLMLGIGMAWLSFKAERRLFIGGRHPIAYLLMPLFWLFAAVMVPALFALIIFRL
jgi:hypothetical protein